MIKGSKICDIYSQCLIIIGFECPGSCVIIIEKLFILMFHSTKFPGIIRVLSTEMEILNVLHISTKTLK